jgi:hypothetical protein
MSKLSPVEWDIIDARVRSETDKRNLRNPSLGFLRLVLAAYFPERDEDLDDIITDGPNDQGVDAIEVLHRDHRAEVFFFQAKYREGRAGTDRTINDTEILRCLTFLRGIFDKQSSLAETGNLQLDEAVKRIWELHKDGVICRYRLVFCSNGQGLSTSAQGILDAGLASLSNVVPEFYGPTDLLLDLGARDRVDEVGSLQVVGREIFERADGDVRGLIATVDARSFIDMIRTEDGNSVKRHLFDDNLRIFLGKNGGYNTSIIATASSPESYLFWYLNNGITITCKDYSYNKSHVGPKIRLENFQIVNGAQTSHSLLEAARVAPEAIENAVVMVRVYATGRPDIVERVAVATNSQARIQHRDLRANSEVLRKFELALKQRSYFFERKRNMYADEDPRKRVDALKLGQIIRSYYLGEPERARTDSDDIFDDQFYRIFHEHYDMDEVVLVIELYQIIEDLRDARRDRAGPDLSDGDFLVFGHWFVLYACRLILGRTQKSVPTGEAAQILVSEALTLVAKTCSSSRSSHYQLFRSSKTKERLHAEFTGAQLSLLDLLAMTPN